MSAALPWSSENSTLHSVDQLDSAAIDALLRRADALRTAPPQPARRFTLGQLFLQPSLRTRVGFAAAAQRLGGQCIDILEREATSDSSGGESIDHTVRVASGLVDVLVARWPLRTAQMAAHAVRPLISGGDLEEHPVQALIDAFAIEQLARPIATCAIGIVGDLNMRATRSMLKALLKRRPRALRLVAPPARLGDAPTLAAALSPDIRTSPQRAFEGLDVVIFCGLPARRADDHMDAGARTAFALTQQSIATLSPDAIVLSPMPVIDEIAPDVMGDPRVGVFRQSDLALFVRMAVLESALELKVYR